jgi:hypothetical protein
MHLILQDADSSDRKIECRHCHWQGLVSELQKGDYLSLTNITEVFCPRCNKYLGFIQHDEKEENRLTGNDG